VPTSPRNVESGTFSVPNFTGDEKLGIFDLWHRVLDGVRHSTQKSALRSNGQRKGDRSQRRRVVDWWSYCTTQEVSAHIFTWAFFMAHYRSTKFGRSVEIWCSCEHNMGFVKAYGGQAYRLGPSGQYICLKDLLGVCRDMYV